MRRLLLLPAALLVLAALLPACSPSLPDASAPALVASSLRGRPGPSGGGWPMDPPSGYFPLDDGDWWQFGFHSEFYVVTDDGSRVDYPPYDSPLEHVVVCSQDRNGLTYHVVRGTQGEPATTFFWIHYREDSDGLYELDGAGPPPCDTLHYDPKRIGAPRASCLPAGATWADVASRLGVTGHEAAWAAAFERVRARRASVMRALAGLAASPAALAPGEIQRLVYPLRPGASWPIRPELNFRAEVEQAVVLRTRAGWFPAWSIRLTNDGLGPDDVVRVWYGRAGYLGLDAQVTSVATDESGNAYGTVHDHVSETLVDLHLARDGGRDGHDRFPRAGLAFGR